MKRCSNCGKKQIRKIKEDNKSVDDKFCSDKCKVIYKNWLDRDLLKDIKGM